MRIASNINIGDILFAIEPESDRFPVEIPPAYQAFLADGTAGIHLGLHSGLPQVALGNKDFDSPPIWSLYRNGNKSFIKIFESYSDLRRLLLLSLQLKRADLYFAAPCGHGADPFFGPTMELLMINYLAQGYGVIMHACGLDVNGKGMLFIGESGAGKSTLANLWDREKAATVLSDDRTIVRHMDGDFRMYGTPWHGEAKFGSPRGVKLEQIFFLRHSRKNGIQPLTRVESVLRMLQCSFPPYWDAAGMEFTMGFFEKVATHVPFHELLFEPDKRVIDFIKR